MLKWYRAQPIYWTLVYKLLKSSEVDPYFQHILALFYISTPLESNNHQRLWKPYYPVVLYDLSWLDIVSFIKTIFSITTLKKVIKYRVWPEWKRMHFYIKHNNNLVSFSVEASPSQGGYDLHISHADYDRDNGKFECRIKEDGTGKLLRPLHSYAAS